MTPEELQSFGIDLAAETCGQPWEYSEEMLSRVSRTFALNIRVLPTRLRRHVLLAYLFCRMADTVEDDPSLRGSEKAQLLNLFATIFTFGSDIEAATRNFTEALPRTWRTSDDSEQFLCLHALWSVRLYHELPQAVQSPIAACVREMCQGMGEFALAQDAAGGWYNPANVAELDRYCHYVAGIVGNLLCDLFREHSPAIDQNLYDRMRKLSESFGLGLQVTNIVKDVSDDVQRGISFLPTDLASQMGAPSVQSLFEPARREQGAAVVRALSKKALCHLEDALEFSLLIPISEPRIRLFCLWPLFLATKSLEAVGDGTRSFEQGKKPKIGRKTVKKVLAWTSLFVWCAPLLRNRFRAHASRIQAVVG